MVKKHGLKTNIQLGCPKSGWVNRSHICHSPAEHYDPCLGSWYSWSGFAAQPSRPEAMRYHLVKPRWRPGIYITNKKMVISWIIMGI
jgi:hypothetical protein